MDAKLLLLDLLNTIDFDEKPKQWRFVNRLMMCVNDGVTLNGPQESVLSTVVAEASCKWWAFNSGPTPVEIFQIAAWVNTCSAERSGYGANTSLEKAMLAVPMAAG